MAHRTSTAPEMWDQMEGKIDAVVAGVGSGGTLTGLAEFFKAKDPSICMVAADPEGSIVADAILKGDYAYDGGSWLVEGVGEDFIPDNFNTSLMDDAETVSDKEAFEVLQIILKEEGILGGSSSGTLVAAAAKWCRKQTEPKNVVTFICDTGNKYLSKAFNKSWLHDNNLLELEKFGDLRDLINRRADKGEMITVSPGETLLVAYNRMRASDISQIPVMDEGKLLGVMDEEDLLFTVSQDPGKFSDNVSLHMIDKLDTLQFDATKDELLTILSEGKVAIIFDKEIFIGFVTKVDLINFYRNKLN
jgi:cystathionine beta-synthase